MPGIIGQRRARVELFIRPSPTTLFGCFRQVLMFSGLTDLPSHVGGLGTLSVGTFPSFGVF